VNLLWLLFSFNGRINRVQFWLGILGAGFGGALLFFLLGIMFMPHGEVAKTASGALQAISSLAFTIAPVYVLLCWIGLALQVKRFHDRGRSGLWTLLPVLPMMMILSTLVGIVVQFLHAAETGIVITSADAMVANAIGSVGIWVLILNLVHLFMFVDLGCMPGKPEANKYGPPPSGGFTGGGAPAGGGTPFPGQTSTARAQTAVPGMGGTTLTGAESAIERAIAAQAKQARAPAPVQTTPRPAIAAAPAAAGSRPATPGSFGRRAAR